MPPISPHTCCSLRYWVDVRGDSIVATCSEVSGWSRWSSKIQQDILWESCWNKLEVGVGKSYSFLSSAASVIEYPDRYHLLYISFLQIWSGIFPNLLGHHTSYPTWTWAFLKFANFQESFKCGTGWSLRSHPTTGGIRHLSRQPMVVVVDLRLLVSSTFFGLIFPAFYSTSWWRVD